VIQTKNQNELNTLINSEEYGDNHYKNSQGTGKQE